MPTISKLLSGMKKSIKERTDPKFETQSFDSVQDDMPHNDRPSDDCLSERCRRAQLATYEAVVIGVSAGGLEALHFLLPRFVKDFALAVMIVQHLHPHSDKFWIGNLDSKCQVTIKQADEKETIKPGVVYIAPANYHLLVEDDKTLSLSVSGRVNYARPSVDVLFRTVADVYGPHVIGIILTGANNDGSRGLKKIKDQGGMAIVQTPATAVVDSMPRAAIEATTVDYVLSLEEIGALLNTISSEKNTALASTSRYRSS